MPVAATFRRTSSGLGSGTGTSSIRSGCLYPYILAARIFMSSPFSMGPAARDLLQADTLQRLRVAPDVLDGAVVDARPTRDGDVVSGGVEPLSPTVPAFRCHPQPVDEQHRCVTISVPWVRLLST